MQEAILRKNINDNIMVDNHINKDKFLGYMIDYILYNKF